MSESKEKPKIAICIDFDCTLTAFHYFLLCVNNKVFVADQEKRVKLEAYINDLYKKQGDGITSFRTFFSKESKTFDDNKKTFIKLLFNGLDENNNVNDSVITAIYEKLKTIKESMNEYHVDYYIASRGIDFTFEMLFNFIRKEMKGTIYDSFLNIFKGIYTENIKKKDGTPTICNMDLKFENCTIVPKKDRPEDYYGEKYNIIKYLLDNAAYKFCLLLDDSDESANNMMFLKTYAYIQPRDYDDTPLHDPGGDKNKINDYNYKYKDYGNSLFVTTLMKKVYPILEILEYRKKLNIEIPDNLYDISVMNIQENAKELKEDYVKSITKSSVENNPPTDKSTDQTPPDINKCGGQSTFYKIYERIKFEYLYLKN